MATSEMVLDRRTCNRARLARDARYDGRFFTGVLTTRIYCRPTCPVRPARSRNVVFFATAAAAEASGFRACLRCRPESAPGTAAWRGAAATISRALRLIDRGFLDEGSIDELADVLGVSARHLRRLSRRYLGASLITLAVRRRVDRARALLERSPMSMAAVAFAAGFSSIRRFNAAFLDAYGVAPSTVCRGRAVPSRGGRIPEAGRNGHGGHSVLQRIAGSGHRSPGSARGSAPPARLRAGARSRRV